MLPFFVNTSRKRRGKELDSHARASANGEKKNRKVCGLANPIHFNRAAKGTKQSAKNHKRQKISFAKRAARRRFRKPFEGPPVRALHPRGAFPHAPVALSPRERTRVRHRTRAHARPVDAHTLATRGGFFLARPRI